MKTVFILFDTVIRKALESYGGKEIKTPNFNRLAEKSVQFNKHYVGSLPCMPARRDMHTGRLNFMHRAWGPLEPFDNSWVRLLREKGTHCHLITDHYHYFEAGGMGFHNTFSSWEFLRGQEYDNWKVMLDPPKDKFKKEFDERHYPTRIDDPEADEYSQRLDERRMQHMVNCEFMPEEKDYCTPRCFESAIEFLDHNGKQDDWVLWLECFDPHEPFHAPERFQDECNRGPDSKHLNWPNYSKLEDCHENSDEDIEKIRAHYAASLRVCDEYLGKILDYFDEHNLWEDTALILTTDHGFLLGEHDWWGKTRQPYYEEISHIPLFVYHPQYKDQGGTVRNGLTQTPDIMPTMLDMYDVPIPKEVRAKSIMPLLEKDQKHHDSVLFGIFSGPMAISDGQYVYYHFPNFTGTDDFYDLHEYTLSPMHMHDYFHLGELATMQLHEGFDFTKNSPLLKIRTYKNSAVLELSTFKGGTGRYLPDDLQYTLGTGLFDVEKDPLQKNPIADEDKEIDRLKKEICRILDAHDTPKEVYKSYALC